MFVDEVLPSPTSLLELGAEPHYEGHLESVLLWHQNIPLNYFKCYKGGKDRGIKIHRVGFSSPTVASIRAVLLKSSTLKYSSLIQPTHSDII